MEQSKTYNEKNVSLKPISYKMIILERTHDEDSLRFSMRSSFVRHTIFHFHQ